MGALFRRIVSWVLWLLGLAGTVYWMFTVGLAIVSGAVLAGVAYIRELPLLLIVLFFGGTFLTVFSLVNHAVGRWNRPSVEERRAQDVALQEYLARMQPLLYDDKPLIASPPQDPRRATAQELTLTVLGKLNPDGKRSVLRFLRGQKLIEKDAPVVRLKEADFSNAALTDMKLTGVNLDKAILRGADLTDAELCSFEMISLREDEAQPKETSSLFRADLSDATLKHTTLAGCQLLGADFDGAELDGADLRGANLRAARNLTLEQIGQAYGSYRQEGWPDTRLENLEPPAAWRKPLSEQKGERTGTDR